MAFLPCNSVGGGNSDIQRLPVTNKTFSSSVMNVTDLIPNDCKPVGFIITSGLQSHIALPWCNLQDGNKYITFFVWSSLSTPVANGTVSGILLYTKE